MRRIGYCLFALMIMALPATAGAHCQVPCGIYNDVMRFMMLDEHIMTIEKAINQMSELSGAADKNYNQIVRWCVNKDDHADQFMDIVSNYFLAQRIKPTESADQAAYAIYQKQLELLHHLTVYAMKCKQTTDLANVEKLKSLVNDFAEVYLNAEQLKDYRGH